MSHTPSEEAQQAAREIISLYYIYEFRGHSPADAKDVAQLIDTHFKTLMDENAALTNALKVAKRMVIGKYLPWANTGGVDDCEHGYGSGIPCPACDLGVLNAALKSKGIEL